MSIARRHRQPARVNPFLSQQPTAGAQTEGVEVLEPVMVTGAPTPTGGTQPPARPVLHLPDPVSVGRLDPTCPVVVQVVGLHGGAGTSTAAGLLGEASVDCGVDLVDLRDLSVPVLLVARTHARGLELLARAGQQWSSGALSQLTVLGSLLVDDAPQLTRGLDRQVQSAQRVLPHSWRLRWSEDLRHDPQTSDGTGLPSRARRTSKSILDAARKQAPTGRGNPTGTDRPDTPVDLGKKQGAPV